MEFLNPQWILVEFGRIPGLVELSRFLRYRVDIYKNLKLVDLSRPFKLQFRIRVASYKTLLLIVRGGK